MDRFNTMNLSAFSVSVPESGCGWKYFENQSYFYLNSSKMVMRKQHVLGAVAVFLACCTIFFIWGKCCFADSDRIFSLF